MSCAHNIALLATVSRALGLLPTQTEKGCVRPLQLSICWILNLNNRSKKCGNPVGLFYIYGLGIATLCTPFGLVGVN
jgi:hypothetical protein